MNCKCIKITGWINGWKKQHCRIALGSNPSRGGGSIKAVHIQHRSIYIRSELQVLFELGPNRASVWRNFDLPNIRLCLDAGTILEVWSELLLLHWLDSPRGLHPISACASDLWTCPQTLPFTRFARKGLELRIPISCFKFRGSDPEEKIGDPPPKN
jgi:hypothetical protein